MSPTSDDPRTRRAVIVEREVVADGRTFDVRFSTAPGVVDECTVTITNTAATVWRTSEREAAEALAVAIDVGVPRPLPPAFRFASDTIPPSLPLAAICQEITTGRWSAFTADA
jgi:hypothetical protein